MPQSRLLTLIAGITLILGLMIWLISSLSWFYSQLSWSASPFVANLLLFLLVVLLGLLIWAVIYYMTLLQRSEKAKKQKRKLKPKVPAQKAEAAEETLKAVRQQVDQIQDQVARQALLSRTREIQASLARGDLQVVVFGTGSAGKTSLVNALMGRMVGRVSAPMGTTEVGETYSLQLRGLEREILITDTPGILEAGVAGTEREELARGLATEADLLLFVVDNDLRQSEFNPLRALAEIGKRSIVVLNKTDIYLEEDKEAILARLRERVRGFVSGMDVVGIAANPQPVRLENGQILEPEPDIMPLIRRMAAILRAEGEDLVADNILLQSQRVGEEARRLLDAQRRRQAEKIVDRFQWIGAGAIAAVPLPVVDLLAAAAVNAQMVVEIGRIYGCELNVERGRELALSLAKTLASLGIVKGAIDLLSAALQLNVSTFAIGKAIQGVTAAYLTRIAGKSFIEYFRQDQDWGDGGITEVVQRQFQLTRKDEFVKAFVKDAIARVVEPLKVSSEEIEPVEEEEEEEDEEEQPQDDWEDRPPRRDDW
jgi:GTPase SAR1 family protein